MKIFSIDFVVTMLGPCSASGVANVKILARCEVDARVSVKYSFGEIVIFKITQID